jgi:uncharacterized membrane protein (UPF0127 family)
MNRPSSFSWRPQTTYFIIGGLVILLVALVVSYIVTHFTPTTEVRLGSGVYHLWVADTDAELKQGLSGVEKLNPGGGLLMKFDGDNTWGIWMKDMKIPLDIVWLNKDKQVVYIVKNASPELSTSQTFTPKATARYVIELPAGGVDKAGIKSGMVADFDETDPGRIW